MYNLVFEHIPENKIDAFAEGVIGALDMLGIDYDFDETSVADPVTQEVTYEVFGVKAQIQ